MPRPGTEGSTVLQTKGLPFSLVGPGDLLALFRCLSCKYAFSLDKKQTALMGAPGRVFSTGEAETSDNVQHSNVSFYNRAEDAKACQITSTVLLPVFSDPGRSQPVAVLEITQFKGSKNSYQAVFNWSRTYLEEGAGMYLPKFLETQTFEMQSHAHSINFSRANQSFGGLFGDIEGLGATGGRVKLGSVSVPLLPLGKRERPAECVVLEKESTEAPSEQEEGAPQIDACERQQPARCLGAMSGCLDGGKGSQERELELAELGGEDVPSGKALLKREDLVSHFGYSLIEAAERLGVSRTTLKRACRRYGIARWPRRALLKAATQGKGSSADLLPDQSGSQAKPSQPQMIKNHERTQLSTQSLSPDSIDQLLEMERDGLNYAQSGSEVSQDAMPQYQEHYPRGAGVAAPTSGQRQEPGMPVKLSGDT